MLARRGERRHDARAREVFLRVFFFVISRLFIIYKEKITKEERERERERERRERKSEELSSMFEDITIVVVVVVVVRVAIVSATDFLSSLPARLLFLLLQKF
jgi:hypothetical protein